MCGICGFARAVGQPDREKFDKMTDMVHYRGPDGRGTFFEEGLALGHRRLSIIDLSEAAGQPFEYMQRYVVVYNGEVYNHPELRAELEAAGYGFRTSSDTETIAAAYACWGEGCVERFNGMWAFVIYDREAHTLFCSRDCFGIKPLYYMQRDGDFWFASEIKQLLPWMGHAPVACREPLLRFLALGQLDTGEYTLFEEVLQLRPGHNMVYDLKTRAARVWQWFALEAAPQYTGSYEEACAEFREKFTAAVALRLRADVPVGSCLSGGLDSSAIVTVAHALLREKDAAGVQHTVSSCYEDKAVDEQEYIDAVLRDTGAISHKIFPAISGGDTAWLDKIIWHMDEPTASASDYSQYSVFGEAKKQGLTVMLDGQGADEQLAGYSPFCLVYFVELLRQRRFGDFRAELRAYKRLRAPFQAVSVPLVAGFSILTALLPRGLMRRLNRAYVGRRRPRVYAHPAWQPLLLDSPEYTTPSTREYLRYNISGELMYQLHTEDRNAMAHSVEGRVPFLDPQLATAVWAMPFGYKMRAGVSKAVMRDALKDYLPPEIYSRYSKLGFPAPEAAWVKLNADWFRAQLEAACARFPGLLQRADVLAGFEKYLESPTTGEFVWWRIMSVNRWAEIFDVQGLAGEK